MAPSTRLSGSAQSLPLSTEAWNILIFQVPWLGRRRQPERLEMMWFSLWICCDWQCGKRGCRLKGLPAASAVVLLRAENIMAFSLCKGKCRARQCLLQSTVLPSLLEGGQLTPVVEGACCPGDTPIPLPRGPQEHSGGLQRLVQPLSDGTGHCKLKSFPSNLFGPEGSCLRGQEATGIRRK